MLESDPEKRPKAADVVDHKWLRQFDLYNNLKERLSSIQI